jgi:hypothetical protein
MRPGLEDARVDATKPRRTKKRQQRTHNELPFEFTVTDAAENT